MISVWFGAAQRGDVTVIKELLQMHIRTVEENGNTALMLATRNGHSNICQILSLYEAGMRNSEGMTALMMAAVANNAELCDILAPLEWPLTLSDGKDALILAAELGNVYALTVLSTHADLIQDASGNTALDYAALHDNIACVRTIIETQKLSTGQIDSAIEKAERTKSINVVEYLVTARLAMKNKSKDETDVKIRELERAVASLQLCFAERENRELSVPRSDAVCTANLPPRSFSQLPAPKSSTPETDIKVTELLEENKRLKKRLAVSMDQSTSVASQVISGNESDETKLLYKELESAATIMKDYEARIDALTSMLKERDMTILQLRTSQLRLVSADPVAAEANFFSSGPDSLHSSIRNAKPSETPKKRAFSAIKKSFCGSVRDGRSRSRSKSVKGNSLILDDGCHDTSLGNDCTGRAPCTTCGSTKLMTIVDNLKLTVSEYESIQACMQAQMDEITRLTDELNGYHNVNVCSGMSSPITPRQQIALQQPASSVHSQQTVLDMEALDTLLVNLDLSNTEEKKAMNLWNIVFQKTLELASDDARKMVVKNLLITLNKDLAKCTQSSAGSLDKDFDQQLTWQYFKRQQAFLPLFEYLPDQYTKYITNLYQYAQNLEKPPTQNGKNYAMSEVSDALRECRREHLDEITSLQTRDDLSNGGNSLEISSLKDKVRFIEAEAVVLDEPISHSLSMPTLFVDNTQTPSSAVSHARPTTPAFMIQSEGPVDVLTGSLPNILDGMTDDDYNPLMRAIKTNNLREIGTTLRYVGESLSDGSTALMLAAEHNCIVAVKYLLSVEAKRTRADGKVALDIALEKGHYKIAELLSAECLDVSGYSRESGRVTELMTAVLDGDMRLAWSLIPLQAGLQDEEGRTALMYAITEGKMNMAQMLIPYEHGIIDKEGRSIHDFIKLFVNDRSLINQLETSLLRCSLRTNSRVQ
ncbi:Protein 21.1 [Giardia lamblia P15]|uniref:Protein 21.1 n=1 Tax=Giardia intestinalis (strain P15) TaxID=658858 RepID=E1F564_GIAIA|nr:Protein 21.1 [Giardia lamblia P15]